MIIPNRIVTLSGVEGLIKKSKIIIIKPIVTLRHSKGKPIRCKSLSSNEIVTLSGVEGLINISKK